MAKLENSTRKLLQAVHTPLEPAPERRPELNRGVLKRAVMAAMGVGPADSARLRSYFEENPSGEEGLDRAVLATVDAAAALTDSTSEGFERQVARVAELEPAAIHAVLGQLIRLREGDFAEGRRALERLQAEQAQQAAGGTDDTPRSGTEGEGVGRASGIPEGFERETDFSGREVFRRVTEEPADSPEPGEPREGRQLRTGEVEAGRTRTQVMLPPDPQPLRAPARVARRQVSGQTLGQLVDWARTAELDVPGLDTLGAMVERRGMSGAAAAGPVLAEAARSELYVLKEAEGFAKQLEIEPVGLLHLERLAFAPDGIERGELSYSVPLAPGEEVSIAHKEWANTSEEFERIVNDFMEEYSEEGVTEKSDISESSSSQQQHSNAFNVGVTATGGYGPVSITSTFGASVSNSASSSQQFSRNQSISVTRKASSRVKKEHKVSFKLATKTGTEDQTVRKFTNPFPDRATRVDYYQLVRKWEVSVLRYGIRLTYDITIPEPGIDVLDRIKEIEDIQTALQEGFAGPNATLAWAQFDLEPSEIGRENYTDLAADYGATVPPPPPAYWYDNVLWTEYWEDQDAANRTQFWKLVVEVPEDYFLDYVDDDRDATKWEDESWRFKVQGTGDWAGKSGVRILMIRTLNLGAAYVEIKVRGKLRADAARAWQLKAWNAMRDGALARYQEQRQILKTRLAELQDQLGMDDALSLRKFEREEIMKGVLRWLFGPDFRFIPAGTPSDLYTNAQSVREKAWTRTLTHGELIKFLHQAIEWENVLYFLYPYFWSHASRWDLKKYLDHPDPTHQAFLKSGSARVVLTIRPGFERDFMSLVETGKFSSLPNSHPYMTIIEEMEAYANTNYPGIPPANPLGDAEAEGEAVDEAEQGVLVGRWYEYTPTSALDIAFDETMPFA